MVLNQWLALIMLRATGPWCVHQSESRELKKQYYHAWIFLRRFRDSRENFKGWFYWELRSQCWTFSVVSIRRFESSRSNELYFDIYLTDFVILWCTLLPLEVFLKCLTAPLPFHYLCVHFCKFDLCHGCIFYKRGWFSFFGDEHAPTEVEIHSFGVCRF